MESRNVYFMQTHCHQQIPTSLQKQTAAKSEQPSGTNGLNGLKSQVP